MGLEGPEPGSGVKKGTGVPARLGGGLPPARKDPTRLDPTMPDPDLDPNRLDPTKILLGQIQI